MIAGTEEYRRHEIHSGITGRHLEVWGIDEVNTVFLEMKKYQLRPDYRKGCFEINRSAKSRVTTSSGGNRLLGGELHGQEALGYAVIAVDPDGRLAGLPVRTSQWTSGVKVKCQSKPLVMVNGCTMAYQATRTGSRTSPTLYRAANLHVFSSVLKTQQVGLGEVFPATIQ
jgi:hypothetical protein